MVPAAFQIRKIVQASVTTTLITRIGQAMCRVALPAGCAVNSVRDTTLCKIGGSETQGACGTVTDWALADIKTPGKSGQLRSCRRRAMFTEDCRDSVGANGRSNPPAQNGTVGGLRGQPTRIEQKNPGRLSLFAR